MFNLIQSIKESRYKKRIRQLGGKIAGGSKTFNKVAEADIEAFVQLGHIHIESTRVSIGAHTYIRSHSRLSLVSSIGRFCSIGSGCVIGQEKNTHPSNWVSSHPFQYENNHLTYRPDQSFATIGHDVWMGEGATILEGVKVGTGAIVGTRALVTRDVPPYAIVGGNPAKIIRYRHPEGVISRLLDSRWWELDMATLKALPLDSPLAFLASIEKLNATQPARYTTLRVNRRSVTEVGIASSGPGKLSQAAGAK
ncbi:CatB-related O-acetyltransferase [Pseudomonas putida]|uniref:CatB-related O-acetyltransferase n=1 Tax=Pseudomonas putida TaxID=303 RepID=A0A7W2L189_PSEPU|nr:MULTISPECIES: CatB-related O-acetyltransferase [Pseudomonas]MBA6116659.1 CatB-related O-acetyltransferase [Pseudomonas putida]MBI6942819.1 CatB-related O-acetyltransferase [Pseudomonas putida]MBI6960598.1 CatB-related O-acetyltransferase [Pseudomonas putida]MCZ9637389.1 CatB-related O-acetyltransferase [Pseudomonas putida]MEC4876907.1 CatB-related O-acetyltransferase [Pseudomonas sp. NC26]